MFLARHIENIIENHLVCELAGEVEKVAKYVKNTTAFRLYCHESNESRNFVLHEFYFGVVVCSGIIEKINSQTFQFIREILELIGNYCGMGIEL